MKAVSTRMAVRQFEALLARVEAGEQVIIARGNRPVAKLVPVVAPRKERRPGAMKGVLEVGPEFFEPLPADEKTAMG